jgi:acetyltransferase-like isoleucine patch superfamily enzyme
MQYLFVYGFKGLKKIRLIVFRDVSKLITFFIFYINNVKHNTFITKGIPRINVLIGGEFNIGKNFRMNNYEMANPIGRFNRCSIIVGNKGKLIIGNNVGISSTAIFCQDHIEIGNNVNIGGNVVIYDTDFHSLIAEERLMEETDKKGTKTRPVKLGDNVFVGAHSTILKGVTIGENCIIGACSVVTKNIPDNEIWAGNPIKFIRTIHKGE